MGQYTKKGLYNSYDRNHKEREALDYYATPTQEVVNILETMNLNLDKTDVLEPCVGGGHMAEGIWQYVSERGWDTGIIGTDIKDRGYCPSNRNTILVCGKGMDFLADDYGELEMFQGNVDYIIMNPPYSVIEPFVIRALEIPTKGVLMLGRLQFLEGEKRFNNIFKEHPPTDVYIYVDRISCYKNGDTSIKDANAQAYAWFYWDLTKQDASTTVHWMRRFDKK